MELIYILTLYLYYSNLLKVLNYSEDRKEEEKKLKLTVFGDDTSKLKMSSTISPSSSEKPEGGKKSYMTRLSARVLVRKSFFVLFS